MSNLNNIKSNNTDIAVATNTTIAVAAAPSTPAVPDAVAVLVFPPVPDYVAPSSCRISVTVIKY